MNVRYRNTFYSIDGVLYQVDILDSQYSGAVNLFTATAQGFNLQYKQCSERVDPLLASTLTVPVMVTDSTVEAFLLDMMTAQEERFYVKVYKSSVLYWVGVLLPDLVETADISYPYDANVTFSDGLGRLKDVDYNTGGATPAPYGATRETIIQHLIKCLGKTGVTAIYDTSDHLLVTCLNWYDSHHIYSTGNDPANYTNLSHSTFYSYDSDGNIEYKKTGEVLEMILRTFNARIFQAGGIYYVIQVQEFARQTTKIRYYSKSGSYQLGYGSASFRLTPTNATRKAGGITKYFAPLYKVTKKFKNRQSVNEDGNLLPIQSDYTTPVALLDTVYYNNVLTFSGTVHMWYSVNSTAWQPFQWRFKCVVVATKVSDPGVILYLKKNGNGSYSWSSSAEYFMYYTPYYEGQAWHHYMLVNFTAPEVDSDYTVTFQFYLVGYYLQNGQTYNPLFIPESDIGFEDLDFQIIATNGNSVVGEDQEIVFNAINTGVLSKMELNIPDTNIGDKPSYAQSIGKLMTSSGGGYYDSVAWAVHAVSGSGKNINQLSVDQNISGQRVPVEKYAGTFINNNITALSCLVMGSKIMVPVSLTISPATDEVTGEWFNCVIPPI